MFFSENGVDCVRFHKSSNDVTNEQSFDTISTITSDLRTTSSFINGDTSSSFVFNSKKLISRGRTSYDIAKANEETLEPTYKGFSSFDEIVLNDPNCGDKISLTGETDSGIGSRKTLQTLDIADLGMNAWSPKIRRFSEIAASSK